MRRTEVSEVAIHVILLVMQLMRNTVHAGCRRNPSGAQTPTSESHCRAIASEAGYALGGGGYGFSGSYGTKGCYAYSSGEYANMAYWGGSGATSAGVPSPKIRISCAGCLAGKCQGYTCSNCAAGKKCSAGAASCWAETSFACSPVHFISGYPYKTKGAA